MANLIKYNDRVSLTKSINLLQNPEPFMLKTYFGTKEFHLSNQINMVRKKNVTGLAQFVPNASEAVTVNTERNEELIAVNIPRTFEKKVFTAEELQRVDLASNPYATDKAQLIALSNQYVLSELASLKRRVELRKEAMACEALTTGKIVYTGDNISFTVDFGFKPNEQLVTLAAADKWGATGVKIFDSIDALQGKLQDRAYASASRMILGTKAASVLKNDENILKQLDTSYNNVGKLDKTQRYTAWGRYLGNLLGIEVYEYSQKYTKSDKTVKDLFPIDSVLLVADVDGATKLHYGPSFRITDSFGLNVDTSELLVEPKKNDDNTAFEWKVEQHSLPIIHAPEAIICAKVV